MTRPADFVAALQRGDRVTAVRIAREMVAGEAPLGDQWRAVAGFASHVGEWTLAIAAMERFVGGAPANPARRLALAELLAQAGRLEEARAIVEPLARADPRDPRYQHFLGTLLTQLGRSDEAAACFEAVLATRPLSGPTWLALAAIRRFRDAADLRPILAAGPGFAAAPPAERAAYLYALGKAHDDAGDHEASFRAFAAGAKLARAGRPYDSAADLTDARQVIGRQSRAWLDTNAASSGGGRVIFVTGLPRSGTTLVEQILAAHSEVADGGELNLLSGAAEAVGGAHAWALEARASQGHGPWRAAAGLYDHLLDERFGQRGRIVDKSLNTSRVAGLARLALPDAPIVWLRRDPLDCAWSCFRTYFPQGMEWSFALADIGRRFAIEELLLAHWREALGNRLLEIPYEEMVADPDAWFPRLLAHCGLNYEPQVRDFHTVDRAVVTSSVAQVRRPLNRAGIGSARPYAAHLAPFVDTYAEARRALGLD